MKRGSHSWVTSRKIRVLRRSPPAFLLGRHAPPARVSARLGGTQGGSCRGCRDVPAVGGEDPLSLEPQPNIQLLCFQETHSGRVNSNVMFSSCPGSVNHSCLSPDCILNLHSAPWAPVIRAWSQVVLSSAQGPALPLPGCATLSKSLNLPEHQTPRL